VDQRRVGHATLDADRGVHQGRARGEDDGGDREAADQQRDREQATTDAAGAAGQYPVVLDAGREGARAVVHG
jgi:hypothetical protein